MIISNIRNTNSIYFSKYQRNNANNNLSLKKNILSVNNGNYVKIPLPSLQSNFMPSFGHYKKVSNALIYERDTGRAVNAVIKREEYGNFYSYKMFVQGKEAGYMDVDFDAIIPEDDYPAIVNDNHCPEITHLRSLSGDKYSGIGTELVKAAVKESYKHGKSGCLWLRTETGYAFSLSDYRSNENPIPFYYKCGFKALNPQTDEYIKKCLETSNFNKLPDLQLLVLNNEAASALKS